MINTSCKLISGLALGLAAPVWAQGWQLTVTEKGVVDGVHVMAIEAPFTYDFHTYQFVLQRDCPRGEPECATLYVLPDAPLPVHFPVDRDYYRWVMAYETEHDTLRSYGWHCFFPQVRPEFACMDFEQMDEDFRRWMLRAPVVWLPGRAEAWQIWNMEHRRPPLRHS